MPIEHSRRPSSSARAPQRARTRPGPSRPAPRGADGHEALDLRARGRRSCADQRGARRARAGTRPSAARPTTLTCTSTRAPGACLAISAPSSAPVDAVPEVHSGARRRTLLPLQPADERASRAPARPLGGLGHQLLRVVLAQVERAPRPRAARDRVGAEALGDRHDAHRGRGRRRPPSMRRAHLGQPRSATAWRPARRQTTPARRGRPSARARCGVSAPGCTRCTRPCRRGSARVRPGARAARDPGGEVERRRAPGGGPERRSGRAAPRPRRGRRRRTRSSRAGCTDRGRASIAVAPSARMAADRGLDHAAGQAAPPGVGDADPPSADERDRRAVGGLHRQRRARRGGDRGVGRRRRRCSPGPSTTTTVAPWTWLQPGPRDGRRTPGGVASRHVGRLDRARRSPSRGPS